MLLVDLMNEIIVFTTQIKLIAFRIKMQDENATLTDEVIETQMANVRSILKKNISELSFRE